MILHTYKQFEVHDWEEAENIHDVYVYHSFSLSLYFRMKKIYEDVAKASSCLTFERKEEE